MQSSSSTLRKPVESPAEVKSTHSDPHQESQPLEQPDDPPCTTPMDTSLAFGTSGLYTPAPHERDEDSTRMAIQASAQDPSVPNEERSEDSQTSSVTIHSPEPNGATSDNESMNFRGSSQESGECASSCPVGKLSKRKRNPPARLSCPPTPLVVVPSLSRSVLCEKATRQASKPSQFSERIVEAPHELDSAPSDDEDDADYLDHSETEDARESLRPSKRRLRSSSIASSASQATKQLFSEPPPAGQPELPPKNSSSQGESIPIQGFLRLRTQGSEVIYSLEFSQTSFSSLFADKQTESPRSHERMDYPATKTPYSSEEDAYIINLRAQNLTWDEIEDQFAERFPRRKKSSLQVHYCSKLKGVTKTRSKRRSRSYE